MKQKFDFHCAALVDHTLGAMLDSPVRVLETSRAGNVLGLGLVARQAQFPEIGDHQVLEENCSNRFGVGRLDREIAVACQAVVAVELVPIPPPSLPLDNLLVVLGKPDKVDPLVERRVVFEVFVDQKADRQVPEDRLVAGLKDVGERGSLFRARQVYARQVDALHPERELGNLVDSHREPRELQGIHRRGIGTG